MGPITLEIRLPSSKIGRKKILWMMEAMVQCNILWLLEHPNTPKLYKAPVRYVKEMGTEIWQDIPNVIKSGVGDCEDLACWRVAELRSIGINARPYMTGRKQSGRRIYHALVRHPNGKIEDPSLAMGMGGVMGRKPIYINP